MQRKAVVIGLGVSGRSASDFLLSQGFKIFAFDSNLDKLVNDPAILSLKEKGLDFFYENTPIAAMEFELAVLSPGISASSPIVRKIKDAGIEVVGEVELALRHIKQPVIGITGTNGKTTTTLLMAHIFNDGGIRNKPLGNVGEPLAGSLSSLAPEETVVLELSSFQLETMASPVLDAAVLLNITPDHLDRYPSINEYAEAKARIEKCLKREKPFIVEERTHAAYKDLFNTSDPLLYGYDSSSTFYTDLKAVFHNGKREGDLPLQLQGRRSHDLENFLAVYAAARLWNLNHTSILKGFNSFKKPPHRMEHVQTVNGVAFINDSKGTNVDAVVRAVESLQGPLLLIAGGVDKGFSYTSWIQPFKNKVKMVFILGEAKENLKRDLGSHFPMQDCKTLEEAVEKAYKKASQGDAVLLSPGCSSFDMFKDYKHRGDVFKQTVSLLMSHSRCAFSGNL